jgi:hypothetical protein
MNDVRCIVYTSFATKSITEQSLKNLLVEARLFNEQQGVTGVLLHHNGAFFQYIEGSAGSDEGLFRVYDKIKQSSHHNHIDELLNTTIERKNFPRWSMASTCLPEASLLSLRNANWRNTISSVMQENHNSSNQGLKLLIELIRDLDALDSLCA